MEEKTKKGFPKDPYDRLNYYWTCIYVGICKALLKHDDNLLWGLGKALEKSGVANKERRIPLRPSTHSKFDDMWRLYFPGEVIPEDPLTDELLRKANDFAFLAEIPKPGKGGTPRVKCPTYDPLFTLTDYLMTLWFLKEYRSQDTKYPLKKIIKQIYEKLIIKVKHHKDLKEGDLLTMLGLPKRALAKVIVSFFHGYKMNSEEDIASGISSIEKILNAARKKYPNAENMPPGLPEIAYFLSGRK
ncbi:MAG: hypothetical protein NT096_01670 [Proteobacteria bacterium]|nr:hypothetical protein [Pseudomonadota bacterium]